VVTVTGGKWTTYRRMGQDTIDHAAVVAGLPKVASRTLDLKLHGWTDRVAGIAESDRVYGADLPMIQQLSTEDPSLEKLLHPRLPYRRREVVWAARYEMARTVEDVLARRTRALFLDARAAIEAAAVVAEVLANELGRTATWRDRDLQSFLTVAQDYVYLGE
jgi:glycerol-3-phosphate dehydrogenase